MREIAVADEPQVVTDDELARAEATMRATGLAQGIRPGLAAAHARFRAERMRENPRYRDARGDAVWLIVWEQPPAELGDGRVVALAREPDTGLVYVTAYRITVPPGALAVAAEALEP